MYLTLRVNRYVSPLAVIRLPPASVNASISSARYAATVRCSTGSSDVDGAYACAVPHYGHALTIVIVERQPELVGKRLR